MMTTLIQFIIAFSVLLQSDSKVLYEPIEKDTLGSQQYASIFIVSDTSKEKAFQILKNKCNLCHSRRNRRRIFSLDNMNLWINDVYTQVFVKKRMPKGKKNKLTPQEYQDLLTWISNTQNI